RFAHEVDTATSLVWEGRRLVRRREARLGGLALTTHDERPQPGPETVTAILDRVRAEGIDRLGWTKAALDLRARVTFLHRHAGEPWPDLGDTALAEDLETWLGPHLGRATGMDDLDRLDLARVIRSVLPYPQAADLDRLAPGRLTVPSGRQVPVDYSADTPTVSVRVQEMFGTTETPRIGDRPVRLELLSPARRPVQITSDLAGFWTGSWIDVRKEMAGRYPKHHWPDDPASAPPGKP
ncbi:MAG TPA: ATP-dependent helicase C-terminal domain-containing protein, partial [Acidimicrobiia bacterium]|nr:ATP-dependent helicase C-terminal domain-containing protein [Acidimicrobiia bacterium]